MRRTTSLAVAVAFTSVSVLAFAAKKEPAKEGPPNDAQIAGIVVAANQVDIDAGELAKKMSTNDEVKAFADRMITDHTAVNKQASDLVTKLGVKPEESATSKSLKDGGKKNIVALKKLKGDAFENAYVNQEVDYHVAVLDAIDKVLIPNAQNAELKDLLTKVRPAIAAHLDHAKEIQAKRKK